MAEEPLVPDEGTEPTVIVEETEDDTPLEVASDKRRVKTDKLDLPVETLHSWATRESWISSLSSALLRMDKTKASRLIESLLLEIPSRWSMWRRASHRYTVVDGQQRLSSIRAFLDGRFPDKTDFQLSGLQVLTELNGYSSETCQWNRRTQSSIHSSNDNNRAGF